MKFIDDTIALFTLLYQILTLWPLAIIGFFMPRKRKDISNEVMFITGAGSGIGRLMAIKFAECGATIISTDLNADTAKETADTIKSLGGEAHSFQLDVTDRFKVYALAEKIRETIGDVTMLVNNAGIVTGKSFLECPDELMIKTMEVNTISHFWTLKAFLGPMLKKDQGHIISVTSIAGFAASPSLVDYSASKFGAVGLHEALTMELHTTSKGVKTTTICPWFIKTGMFQGTKSCAPILLPMLEPDYVAEQIVAGVLNNDAQIFLPWRLKPLVFIKHFFPFDVSINFVDFLKLDEQMREFVGRKKAL